MKDYSLLVRRKVDVKYELEATYEKVTGSGSAGSSTDNQKLTQETLKITEEDINYVGGNPYLEPHEWIDSVYNNPAPIEIVTRQNS